MNVDNNNNSNTDDYKKKKKMVEERERRKKNIKWEKDLERLRNNKKIIKGGISKFEI